MKKALSSRFMIFFILIGISTQNISLLAAEQPKENGWQHRLQKHMHTLKRTVACAFTKEGCTREQVTQIGAVVGAIIFTLGIAKIGTWAYGREQYVQQQNAKDLFNAAVKHNSLDSMFYAVKAGLKVGKKELAAIRKIYDKEMKEARALGDANKMIKATQYKDNLREFFQDRQYADDLIAKKDFWDWIAVYGS